MGFCCVPFTAIGRIRRQVEYSHNVIGMLLRRVYVCVCDISASSMAKKKISRFSF